MLGELTNITADTLIEVLFAIMMGAAAPTATDFSDIEQLERELKARHKRQCWMFEA
jgi:hypothetical protein